MYEDIDIKKEQKTTKPKEEELIDDFERKLIKELIEDD